MDYAFSIALNEPPGRRDMEAYVGDDFNVVAKLFAKDGDVDPVMDFTGTTVDILVGFRWVPPGNTIAGAVDPLTGQITFDLSGVDFNRYWGRAPWIMRVTTNDRRRVVAQGFIVVHGDCGPYAWPNDYGYQWWGW